MFKQPLFLSLFALVSLFLWLRHQRYFLRHSYVDSLSQVTGVSHWRVVKAGCFYLALACFIFAAADPQFQVTEQKHTMLVHKYVLINDGSGSMVEGNKDRGVGRALGTVQKGNEVFLKLLDQRNDGSKDLVGAIVFSNDAYIVSHLVDDPAFVAKKLSYVDYRNAPMNGGTQLEKALWAGVFLAMNVNKGTELSDDMNRIQVRMYGYGFKVKQDAFVKKVVDDNQDRVKGASLVIFTDGVFYQPEGANQVMSCYKIMDFCKLMGIRIYVISVEQLQSLVMVSCKETGGSGVVIKEYNQARFDQAYTDIVKSQANEYVVTEKVADKSLAMWMAIVGLCFFLINLVLANTISRVFTEV